MSNDSKQVLLNDEVLFGAGRDFSWPKDTNCIHCFCFPEKCIGVSRETGIDIRIRKNLKMLTCYMAEINSESPYLKEKAKKRVNILLRLIGYIL